MAVAFWWSVKRIRVQIQHYYGTLPSVLFLLGCMAQPHVLLYASRPLPNTLALIPCTLCSLAQQGSLVENDIQSCGRFSTILWRCSFTSHPTWFSPRLNDGASGSFPSQSSFAAKWPFLLSSWGFICSIFMADSCSLMRLFGNGRCLLLSSVWVSFPPFLL